MHRVYTHEISNIMFNINNFMLSFRSYLREMFEKPENIPVSHPDMTVPHTEDDPEKYLSGGWKDKVFATYKHTFTNPTTGQEHQIVTDLARSLDNSALVSFSVDNWYRNYKNRISDLSVAAYIAKVVHGHVAHYAHHTGIDSLRFSVLDSEENKEKRVDLYGKLARSLGLRAFRGRNLGGPSTSYADTLRYEEV